MSRTLSSAANAAIFTSQTNEVFLVLLELTGGNIVTPIRVSSNNVDTTSNGDVYTAYPFHISMPPETDKEIPSVQLVIDNIDQTLIQEIRGTAIPILIEMNIVLAGTPDTIEAGPFNYTLRNITYDALTISGDLMFEDVLNEPYPAGSYDTVNYPGLFQ
jgi:hypothetical protein